MILPLVLLTVVALAMLSLSMSFTMHAELAGAQNAAEKFQLRLAAESGIQRAINVLRTRRSDMTAWYDNEDEFHGFLIWDSLGSGASSFGTIEDLAPGQKVYRVSSPADDPEDDDTLVRWGLTDEASKLNIRLSSNQNVERYAAQVTKLLEAVVVNPQREMIVEELVDALIDWQDTDSEPRENGVETEYYEQLLPRYYAQNRPLSTVEELLLIRGFTAEVVFGDDYNRNGLLDPNEDDGEDSFPPDNGDGKLDRGLAPFVTVYSVDLNTSNDNRARVLPSDPRAPEKLEADFTPDEIQAIRRALQTASRPPAQDTPRTPAQGATPRDLRPGFADAVRGDEPLDLGAIDPLFDGGPAGQGGNQSTGGNRSQSQPPRVRTPADLFIATTPDGESFNLDLELLPLMMDRIMVVPSVGYGGLININTAPREVLATLPELTGEEVDEIIARRGQVHADSKRTTAWLVTENVLPMARYRELAPWITARGQQFTIEAIGHADHMGMSVRIQAVVEMKGKIHQILYYRDYTRLGIGYPVRADEGDRGFAGRTR